MPRPGTCILGTDSRRDPLVQRALVWLAVVEAVVEEQRRVGRRVDGQVEPRDARLAALLHVVEVDQVCEVAVAVEPCPVMLRVVTLTRTVVLRVVTLTRLVEWRH